MTERSNWPDSRIDQLEITVRALAPTAAQLARIEATVEALDAKVERVESGVADGRKSMRNTLLLILGPVAGTGVLALGSVLVDRLAG